MVLFRVHATFGVDLRVHRSKFATSLRERERFAGRVAGCFL